MKNTHLLDLLPDLFCYNIDFSALTTVDRLHRAFVWGNIYPKIAIVEKNDNYQV